MTPKEQAIEMWWLIATGEEPNKRKAYERVGGEHPLTSCPACDVAREKAEIEWDKCEHCPMRGKWKSWLPEKNGLHVENCMSLYTYYSRWFDKDTKWRRDDPGDYSKLRGYAVDVLFNIYEGWPDD